MDICTCIAVVEYVPADLPPEARTPQTRIIHCALHGGPKLVAKLEAAEKMAAAFKRYAEWMGPACMSDDCDPVDCECEGRPVNAAVNSTLAAWDAAAESGEGSARADAEREGSWVSIKTGDTVKHGPTGETWTVAYVDGERLAWCGWPPGEARLMDCALVKSCSDAESLALIRELAAMRGDPRDGYDRRKSWAHRFLASLPEAADASR